MRFFMGKLIWLGLIWFCGMLNTPFIKKHNRVKFSNEAEIFQGLLKNRNLFKLNEAAFFRQPL